VGCEKRKAFLSNPASQNKPVEGAAAQRLVQSRTSTWLAPVGENFDSQQLATRLFRRLARNECFVAWTQALSCTPTTEKQRSERKN
jgi:hypothetical protein